MDNQLMSRSSQTALITSSTTLSNPIAGLSAQTVEEAQKSDQLSKALRENKTVVRLALMAAITEVAALTQSKMEGNLNAQFADLLIEDWWHFKIDDIFLALKNGAKGKYGRNYGSVSSQDLRGWMVAYDSERNAHYQSKDKEFLQSVDKGPVIDVDYDLWKENQKKAKGKRRLIPPEPPTPEDLEELAKKKESQLAALEAMYPDLNEKK